MSMFERHKQRFANANATSNFGNGFDASPNAGAIDRAGIDQGLRGYMNRVYSLMSAGVGITGAAAWLVAQSEALTNLIFTTPLLWVVALAPLAMLFVMVLGAERMAASTLQMVFWVYAGLVGLSMSAIFGLYTDVSIVKTFFITAAAFAGLSLYGYTTKRSLSAMGAFCIMGLIGLIVAMIVNMFVGSAALDFGISVLGVLIFAGLTAWNTQKIKNLYLQGRTATGDTVQEKPAILGALTLYLDFINLFLFLLRFLGHSRS